MKQEFRVALAPTDDLLFLVAQWRVRRDGVDGPAMAQIFEDANDAREWLEAAAIRLGFPAPLDAFFETRSFRVVAIRED